MTEPIEDRLRLAGTSLDGRFAIERAVARGGFGLVYRATHVELAAPVAVKVLLVPEHLRGAESSLVARFRQEARTLAQLQHPAVVRVLDVGRLDAEGEACVWMALEWLDGVTLDAHLRARGGLGHSPREALALLAPALDAITCAHERGIAHRDLKPANLMVVPARQGDVSLCVLDFGIAKAMCPDEAPGSGHTETRSEHSAFSLPYAAPEQVGRMRTGPWTDVHALGLLLSELLTGRAPYAGDDSFTLYAAVMAPARPTPARHGVRVGPWEEVLAKALALHPSDRFARAGELHAALLASVNEAQRAWERDRAARTARASSALRASPRRRVLVFAGALAASACALTAWGLTRPPRAPVAAHVVAPRGAPPVVATPVESSDPPPRAPAPEVTAARDVPAPVARPRAAVPPRTTPRPPRRQAAAQVTPETPSTYGSDDIAME